MRVRSKIIRHLGNKKYLFRKLYLITFKILPTVLPLLVAPLEDHLWNAIEIRCCCSDNFFSRLKLLPFQRGSRIGEESEVTRYQYERVGSLLNSGVLLLTSKTRIM